MSNQVTAQKAETVVLAEGAAWGDAEFYGRWLLDAAKANDLLNEAKDDDEFRKRIETCGRTFGWLGLWDHGDSVPIPVFGEGIAHLRP